MYFNTFFFNQLLISFDFCYRIIKVLPAVLVFSLLNQYPVAEFFVSFTTPLSPPYHYFAPYQIFLRNSPRIYEQ